MPCEDAVGRAGSRVAHSEWGSSCSSLMALMMTPTTGTTRMKTLTTLMITLTTLMITLTTLMITLTTLVMALWYLCRLVRDGWGLWDP